MTSKIPEPDVKARRSLCITIALAHALAGLAIPAASQDYASRPIRMIVPTGTGTTSDMVARLLAVHLGKSLGQGIVVENLPGTGGVTGTQQLVRARKDGYTIALLSNNHVINPSVYKSLPYDTINDVAAISSIGTTPLVLLANPQVPARNLQELLQLARATPGKLTYGSGGNGTVRHLAAVLLTSLGNVGITHVPYRENGQFTTDVLSGQVDMGFFPVAAAIPMVESGRLRAIGMTTTRRSPLMPNVPTLAEAGLPNYNFDGWMMLAGPAGLPQSIVNRLNAEVKSAMALREVQESLEKMGVLITVGSPDDATQFLKSELDKHSALAKRGGATLD